MEMDAPTAKQDGFEVAVLTTTNPLSSGKQDKRSLRQRRHQTQGYIHGAAAIHAAALPALPGSLADAGQASWSVVSLNPTAAASGASLKLFLHGGYTDSTVQIL
jgi:hypothetical protein